jgi:hypothetical protein
MASGEALTCRVRGISMQPLLADGERVELARERRYWPGDVVALVSPGGHPLVHRLLGFYPRRGRWLAVTRGDAAPAADSPVPLSALLGRVVAAEGRRSGLAPVPWSARLLACGRFVGFLAGRLRR